MNWQGLNRTSVGLKHSLYICDQHPFARLNRTSVGLKRAISTVGETEPGCLNRTSVGLKPYRILRDVLAGDPASIEPAWD